MTGNTPWKWILLFAFLGGCNRSPAPASPGDSAGERSACRFFWNKIFDSQKNCWRRGKRSPRGKSGRPCVSRNSRNQPARRNRPRTPPLR